MRASESDPQRPDPLVPLPGEWHRHSQLRNGTPILVRPIRPSDRDHLAEGLKRLSPASRYLRFHTVVDALTDEQLDYLTNVDHYHHEAVVAADLTDPVQPGVGVARCIREPFEPTVAETAVTVADEYQGRGAATALLQAIAARARELGVHHFRSYVLEGNTSMLDMLERLGADLQPETDRLWRVDIEVPADTAAGTESPQQKLLAALHEQRRLASILPPIWSRWRRELGSARFSPSRLRPEAIRDSGGPAEPPLSEELEELRGELDRWLRDRDGRV